MKSNYSFKINISSKIFVSVLLLCLFAASNLRIQAKEASKSDLSLLSMGMLDVTASPYFADNTGTNICTQAIKKAIRDAQEKKIACYFPSGTYLVDDTISGVLRCVPKGDGVSDCTQDRRKPVYLLGATNPRPVIKLCTNAQSATVSQFDNEYKPLPVFWLWAETYAVVKPNPKPEAEQSNINFNMVIRNLIIDLNGHKGAMGIRFAGAQGSTIEDIKVIATGAFAGISGTPGQAGGCYNIEVEGGRHAWYFHKGASGTDSEYGNGKFSILAGLTFRNQTSEVFKIDYMAAPMTIVGFHIEKQTGSLFSRWIDAGGISMVDGIVEYTSPTSTALTASITNNLYMKNVFFKNCGNLYAGDANTALNATDWSQVVEYKFTKSGSKAGNLIDGVYSNSIAQFKKGNATPPQPIELIRKHTWDPLTFVSIEMQNDADFVSVKDPLKMTGPAGIARGDGSTNDTKALQWALKNFKKVYLPNGTYTIDSTLVLNSQTQIFGAGKTYSVIKARSAWKTTSPKTMITTVDDKDATTSISFLLLEINYLEQKNMNKITWRAGRNSIIRDIMFDSNFAWNPLGNSFKCQEHQMFKFTGSAGGRVYALGGEYNAYRDLTFDAKYRHILIENTTEPLRFYSCNVERVHSGVQFEINNSSNIEIYYLKSEASVKGSESVKDFGWSTPLLINNSNNISVYSLCGKLQVATDQAFFVSNNSTGIIATGFKSHQSGVNATCNMVKELYDEQQFKIMFSQSENMGIFSRNYVFTDLRTTDQSSSKIYPNPMQEILQINNSESSTQKIIIRQLTGTILYQSELRTGTSTVDVSFLKPGIYLVQVVSPGGKSYSSKVIKI